MVPVMSLQSLTNLFPISHSSDTLDESGALATLSCYEIQEPLASIAGQALAGGAVSALKTKTAIKAMGYIIIQIITHQTNIRASHICFMNIADEKCRINNMLILKF